MSYTVVSLTDEDGAQGSGLTLSEAFTRMMAFARCDYAFARFNGDMVLSLTQADEVSDGGETEPPPALRSKQLDGDRARTEIMRRFVNRDMNGYRIMTDEDWHREEIRRCDREGSRSVRRIDQE
jgi:hypothetical protein